MCQAGKHSVMCTCRHIFCFSYKDIISLEKSSQRSVLQNRTWKIPFPSSPEKKRFYRFDLMSVLSFCSYVSSSYILRKFFKFGALEAGPLYLFLVDQKSSFDGRLHYIPLDVTEMTNQIVNFSVD